MRRFVLACCTLTLLAACGGDGNGDPPTEPPGSQDQDSDGVFDVDDLCPSVAETANQWEDEDGCPDSTDELYQLARTDIEAFWQRTFTAGNESYVPIGIFQGYETEISTGCGAAAPRNAFYCGPDHGIYYHNSYLTGFLNYGPYAPHFIIAHEFSHSVQIQLGLTQEFYPAVVRELQADCFGGAYTRDARTRGLPGWEAMEASVLAVFRDGDPLDPWFDPERYGTPGQRGDGFTVGLEGGPAACVALTPPPPLPAPGAASTTTTITADTPDPSRVDEPVVINVEVTSTGATPTGSVIVNVLGGSESCSGTLSGGSMTCAMVFSRLGSRTLIGSYAGNASFAPSTDAEEHTVQTLPSAVEKVSGDVQTGAPSSELPNPLVVRVRDSNNNPISGREVTWVVSSGRGSVSPESGTTDSQGQASTRWTLGNSAGTNLVDVTVLGVGGVRFSATATAGAVQTTPASR